MPVDDTKLNEGDALAAAALNTRFSAIAAAVNALDPSDVEQGSLGYQHVPGLVGDTEFGATAVHVAGGDATTHSYTNVYNTFAVITDGTTPASITWTAFALGSNTSQQVYALLVLGNVEVVRVHENPAGAGDPSLYSAAIRVAYRNAVGTWVGIDRTERFVSTDVDPSQVGAPSYDATYRDVAIRTLVTDSDVGGTNVQGIRLEVAFNDPAGGGTNPRTVLLLRYRLTVLPLFCEVN